MPNKIARPAREWLSAELDARREQVLAALDADPAMLLRMWEWCYGRPPQAVDLSVSNPGNDAAERVAAALQRLGPGQAEIERDEEGRVYRILVRGDDAEVRGFVYADSKVYVTPDGGDPDEDIR